MQKIFTTLLLSLLLLPSLVAQQTVSVGNYDNTTVHELDGLNNHNSPWVMTYTHSFTQTLYTASELSEISGGQITKVQFRLTNYDYSFDEISAQLKLYLTETSRTDMTDGGSGSQWEEVELTAPLSTITVDVVWDDYFDDYELEFTLTQPFIYNGRNLIVSVMSENDPFVFTSPIFYTYRPENVRRTLIYADDNAAFSSVADDVDISYKDIPVAKFTYTPGSATGIDPIVGQNAKVYAQQGAIAIEGITENSQVSIYTLTGSLVYSNTLSGNNVIPVAENGFYLVKVGEKAYKIAVK